MGMIRCLITCVALLTPVSSWQFAHAQDGAALTPLWNVDLREAGYSPQPGFQFSLSSRPHTVALLSQHSVTVSQSGHIAIAFLTEEIGGKSTDIYGSRVLHLISLDAATGRIVANRAWAVPNADTYVGASKEGNLVMLRYDSAGPAVCVYSPYLQEIRRIDFPSDPVTSTSSWSIFVPPSGTSVFVEHRLNNTDSVKMLDSRTLREVRAWENSGSIESVSGHYFLWCEGQSPNDVSLYTWAFETPWSAVANLGPCLRSEAAFINEDTLVMNRRDSVSLIRADGQVLFTAPMPKNRAAEDAGASPDGRFVIVATTTKAGLAIALAFDMSKGPAPRRILVYDTKTSTVVDSLRFTSYVGAFSPDSSRFAVLNGRILKMYQLPSSVSAGSGQKR